ncbi:hypothetical protein OCEANICA350_40005 [Oceanicaulis sp. 350]|nr:hypothetical protein OCEANICA350_40005 [Oceanicaulis sp. 350]
MMCQVHRNRSTLLGTAIESSVNLSY